LRRRCGRTSAGGGVEAGFVAGVGGEVVVEAAGAAAEAGAEAGLGGEAGGDFDLAGGGALAASGDEVDDAADGAGAVEAGHGAADDLDAFDVGEESTPKLNRPPGSEGR
jgi:hypothetical protein